ncbi:hypothetical protein K1719_018840 [Acacia pycnantha]|nr:hypothetical protein K1719_018840 [Acacia pycnantha]
MQLDQCRTSLQIGFSPASIPIQSVTLSLYLASQFSSVSCSDAVNLRRTLVVLAAISSVTLSYADDCIVERVTEFRCFIVATCDRDLKRRIRKIPGVLIMYMTKHKYSIEQLPEATIGEDHASNVDARLADADRTFRCIKVGTSYEGVIFFLNIVFPSEYP